MPPKVFFGYPQYPAMLAEVMTRTARSVRGPFVATTWQDLNVGGNVVIRKVLEAIDDCDVGIFDITYPNSNVLFEVGYALSRAKRLLLTMDTTVASAKNAWNDLAILKPIGYEPYRNSDELSSRLKGLGDLSGLDILYDSLIEPALVETGSQTSLLYCPPFEPFEAANRLTALVGRRQRRGLEVVSADPTESSLNPITWYAPHLGSAAGVLIHFAGDSRNRSGVHNQRNALVAGMAAGMDVPLLMLAETDYSRPFDYESLLTVYPTVAGCIESARGWLDGLTVDSVRLSRRQAVSESPFNRLRFGEHVAENEISDLPEYFLETSAFQEVIAARDALFVGHRGTGKTATALQAYERLSQHRDYLAVLIKPSSFEFPALLDAMGKIPSHSHEYLFNTLWRFLVQTEIAAKVLTLIDDQPAYLPRSSVDTDFLAYVESAPFNIRADMSVRLDQVLVHLSQHTAEAETVESGRAMINEAFHSKALEQLRHHLGPVLKTKSRVAVFIDNLDKGWQKQGQLELLARLILGLLSARGWLVTDFGKEDWWRDKVRLTMAVFLRSDIFTYVQRVAREPDKLSPSAIRWREKETLVRVLAQRVEHLWPGRTSPRLFGDVFCESMAGESTRDFILKTVQPRPRDLIFFANAALGRAIDLRHEQVTEEDVASAVDVYSQYAYEALLVENGITIPELEEVLFTFLGAPKVFTVGDVRGQMRLTQVDEAKYPSVIMRLVEMSFLGLETSLDVFTYPEVGSDLKRAVALSKRLQPDSAKVRVKVHPAYRAFLGIEGGAAGDS